mmetsp:Transcript_1580/g.3201  ORF Transcript_1580/g.3201 Transcript_1580/m.3201 type:complete len:130 (-) Transcript_1580:96-485(-)
MIAPLLPIEEEVVATESEVSARLGLRTTTVPSRAAQAAITSNQETAMQRQEEARDPKERPTASRTTPTEGELAGLVRTTTEVGIACRYECLQPCQYGCHDWRRSRKVIFWYDLYNSSLPRIGRITREDT